MRRRRADRPPGRGARPGAGRARGPAGRRRADPTPEPQPAAPAGAARARAAAVGSAEHEGAGRHGRQAGQGRHRVRQPRGPRADLPRHQRLIEHRRPDVQRRPCRDHRAESLHLNYRCPQVVGKPGDFTSRGGCGPQSTGSATQREMARPRALATERCAAPTSSLGRADLDRVTVGGRVSRRMGSRMPMSVPIVQIGVARELAERRTHRAARPPVRAEPVGLEVRRPPAPGRGSIDEGEADLGAELVDLAGERRPVGLAEDRRGGPEPWRSAPIMPARASASPRCTIAMRRSSSSRTRCAARGVRGRRRRCRRRPEAAGG